MKRKAAKELIEKYYFQLVSGCGLPYGTCDNPCCFSSGLTGSPSEDGKTSKNNAAARALHLYKTKARLCPHRGSEASQQGDLEKDKKLAKTAATDTQPQCLPYLTDSEGVPYLTEQKLVSVIEQCVSGGGGGAAQPDYKPLIRAIGEVFSNPVSLSRSFLITPVPQGNTQPKQQQADVEMVVDGDVVRTGEDNVRIGEDDVRIGEDDVRIDEDDVRIDEDDVRIDEDDVRIGGDNVRISDDVARISDDVARISDDVARISDDVARISDDVARISDDVARTESGTSTVVTQKETASESMEVDRNNDVSDDDDLPALETVPTASTSSAALPDIAASYSVPEPAAVVSSDDTLTLDIGSMERAVSRLFSIPGHPFLPALGNAIVLLSEHLTVDLMWHGGITATHNPRYINIFIIVMEVVRTDGWTSDCVTDAFPAFCKCAASLSIVAQARLCHVWATYPADRLQDMVNTLHQFITVDVITGNYGRNTLVNDSAKVTNATEVMRMFYYAAILGALMGKGTPASAAVAAASGNIPLTSSKPVILDNDDAISERRRDSDRIFDLMPDHIGLDAQSSSGGASTSDGESLFKEKSKVFREDPLSVELGVRALDCREPLIPYSEFVNELLSEHVEMDKDYAYYRGAGSGPGQSMGGKFSFMNFNFILTTAAKTLGLFYDNRIRMCYERRSSVMHSLLDGVPSSPYLKLRVRRDNLIADALIELEMVTMQNPAYLKKQLFVEFVGEHGVDEGGVSKEFMQLVVEDIFNPDYGMFILNAESQTYYFNPGSFESDGQFTLIGIMLGLAIYNHIILDVHFPMLIYRKLCGKKGTLLDLRDSHTTVYNSLCQLLEMPGGEVEDAMMLTFQISTTDIFGDTQTAQLKPDGNNIPVTGHNRQEYVDLYANYLLNESVERHFSAFYRGFHMVTDDSPLSALFRPEEIELLVCGSKDFDFNALEESTEYDGGYHAASPVIIQFWDIVHNEMTERDRRKLLQFTTGSDRIPVGGLSKLRLIIARHGPDSDRLPSAHTCYNVLLIPEYSNKQKLKGKLFKAITHAKGFGML